MVHHILPSLIPGTSCSLAVPVQLQLRPPLLLLHEELLPIFKDTTQPSVLLYSLFHHSHNISLMPFFQHSSYYTHLLVFFPPTRLWTSQSENSHTDILKKKILNLQCLSQILVHSMCLIILCYMNKSMIYFCFKVCQWKRFQRDICMLLCFSLTIK